MNMDPNNQLLRGKRGLVVGIANDQSIAYGCAKACRNWGADLAVTYLNEKAKPHVEPLAQSLDANLLLPLDVRVPEQMDAVFAAIEQSWGQLDFLIHSIAFAPKPDLHNPLIESSSAGFLAAMDVSCHSFIRLAKAAVPLMKEGGALVTMTYFGAEKVVPHYNLMGPVKAALEASVRYLSFELGPKNIRVHAVSPGPMATRAASGLKDFDQLLDQARERAPVHSQVDIDDVGAATAFLVTPQAEKLTGNVIYIDGGYNVMG